MRLNRREKLSFMVAGDIVAMLIAFTLAIALGHRGGFSIVLYQYYGLSIVFFCLLIPTVFVIIDAYSLSQSVLHFMRIALMVLIGVVLSGIAATFIIFFLRGLAVPRAVFILFLLCSFALITAFRYVNIKFFSSFSAWRVLLVGDREISKELAGLINSRQYLHYHLAGYLSDEPEAESYSSLPFLGKIDNMSSVAHRNDIDQIVVTQRKIGKGLITLLLECMRNRIDVTDFKNVIEEITGKVPVTYLDEYWFIMELRSLNKKYFWYLKRTLDVLISVIGIILLLPFLPIVALAIKMDSPGTVLYFQTRVGRHGKSFRVWKLRTMVQDADKDNVHWTMANDDRITRLGSFLRKVRADEFPQFVNILKGDMTLVGPRPEAETLVELYTREIPFYAERHMVTPGVTGWAQINYGYGNSIEDARVKLKYDLYYIKNRNIILDLVIILKTIRTVTTGAGAL